MGSGNTKRSAKVAPDAEAQDAQQSWATVLPAPSLGKAPTRERMEVEDVETAVDEASRVRATADEASLVYLGHRDGRVLRKQTILKADHYPSCHNKSLPELLEGAPNFRAPCEGVPIFGTAAPTRAGLRRVCARAARRAQPIVWCNLRQEPCIYIHGRPFCVKDRVAPFKAIENVGVMSADVEQAEVLLKKEVVAEALAFRGRVLALDETAPSEGDFCAKGELYSYWEENVRADSVHTPREIFEMVQRGGAYSLCYHRVAITDEQAPPPRSFDAIARHMRSGYYACRDTSFVFNCALGRGRTTSGLVIACLLWRSLARKDDRPSIWDMSQIRMIAMDGEADYAWGEYDGVRRLVALLPKGAEGKAFVDAVIDKCAHMQNLRGDVLPKRATAMDANAGAKKREQAMVTGRKYLERYMYLILFNCYVRRTLDQQSTIYQASNGSHYPCFKDWLDCDQAFASKLYNIFDHLTLD